MEISEINAGSKISSVKDQSGTKVQNVILCKARQRAGVCNSLKWVGVWCLVGRREKYKRAFLLLC